MADPLTPEQKQLLMRELHVLCNKLHHYCFIPIDDINAYLLGMVTKSLEGIYGRAGARELITAAMDNVWPIKPAQKRWFGRRQ